MRGLKIPGLKIPASNGALMIKIDFAVQLFRLKRQLVPRI